MGEKLSKIKENLPALFKKLPALFSKHFSYVVLVGAILALLFGGYFFYRDAWQVTNDSYDVFVTVRKVNTRLFEDAKAYLELNNTYSGSLPSGSPFSSSN